MTAREERNEKGKLLQTIAGQREQIKRLEAELKAKEVEIKEIHHRVKNNLQVVASMLNMQAKKTESNEAAEALEEARDRVYTMAYVYEQLQFAEKEEVSMRGFVTGIISQYGFADMGVSASIDIPEDMLLPAEQAIPCGWIINELMSNAFKYAFQNGKQGEVAVAMKVVKGKMSLGFRMDGKLRENDKVELIVSDNGVGLRKDFNPLESETMGRTIVNSLVEQIDGEVEVDTTDGIEFTIRFEI